MRDNKSRDHRDRTRRRVFNALGGPPVYTAGQRKTMQMGLRILARMIARAHLRREVSGAASAPPPDRGAGD